MGIPSYFSYIVKNHNKIIKKLNIKVNYLFLDSNSIIYDSFHSIINEYDESKKSIFEDKLIKLVCKNIEKLFYDVKPNKLFYISFDGVAPVAKLEQQRNRRFKSYFENIIEQKINPDYKPTWDKCAITPGTEFMNKLNYRVYKYFSNSNLPVKKILVSATDEPGEGEHKIFSYIRNNNINDNDNLVVYGLDADLIMLALNHLNVNKNIFLYRETPEFIKSIDKDLNPGEKYIMDIPLLGKGIINEMNFYNKNKGNSHDYRLHDYIFLCFFLGNDFLPHFPSINIRTNGILKLMSAYQTVIGNSNMNLTNGKDLYWNNVSKFIEYLSEQEWDNIIEQYKIKDKMERKYLPSNNYKEKKYRYLLIPTKDRTTEKYIDPYSKKWENRYYEKLLHCENNIYYKKKISINYLEGLEWTTKYYSGDCVNWSWKYNYNYPPLLKDLKKFVPNWNYNFIEETNDNPIEPVVQLSYVLPLSSLFLVGNKNYHKLVNKYPEYYDNNVELEWAYCKYMWESHAILPEIEIDNLNKLLLENR